MPGIHNEGWGIRKADNGWIVGYSYNLEDGFHNEEKVFTNVEDLLTYLTNTFATKE